MPFYEIKANGRYHDTVYTERSWTIDEMKKEYQKLLNTKNIKVKKIHSQ